MNKIRGQTLFYLAFVILNDLITISNSSLSFVSPHPLSRPIMSQRPRRSAAKAAQIVISKVTGKLQDRKNQDSSDSDLSSSEDQEPPQDVKSERRSTAKLPRGGRGRKRERSASPVTAKSAGSPKKTEKAADSNVSEKGSPPKKVVKIISKPKPVTPAPERVKKPAPPQEADIDEIEDELDGENVDIVVVDNSAMKSEVSEDYFEDTSTDEDEENGVPLKAAGLGHVIELGKGTSGRCGTCHGCKRPKCGECSACKRGDLVNCIDDYCTEDEKGRAVRAAAKELYIKSQAKADANKSTNDPTVLSNAILKNKQQLTTGLLKTKDGAVVVPKSENNPPTDGSATKKKPADYVYGASASAAKSRRCGECEGCMRDDCGECIPCKDKPRFGGRGTKKRACIERACRVKVKTWTTTP